MRSGRLFFVLLFATLPLQAQFGFPVRLDLITPGADFFGGDTVLIPDFDGDGQGDLLVGAPGLNANAGGVFVVRGGFAVAVATLVGSGGRFGAGLAALADLDGDGVQDFAVGAPTFGLGADLSQPMAARGQVTAFSGATLQVLWTAVGSASSNEQMGWGILPLPDLNGDGIADLGVRGGPELFGVVDGLLSRTGFRILSGADGIEIAGLPMSTLSGSTVGLETEDWAGSLVADFDGDGADEIIIARTVRLGGGLQTTLERWSAPAGGAGASVLLGTFTAGTGGYARRLKSIADRDGDGLPEVLLVEAPIAAGAAGSAVIVDPLSGLTLATRGSGQVRDAFALRDLDGDGSGEIAVVLEDNLVAPDADRIRVLGANGTVLFEEVGAAGGRLRRVLDVPDRNDDDIRELLFLSAPSRAEVLAGTGPLNTHFRVRSPYGAFVYEPGTLTLDWAPNGPDATGGVLSLSAGAPNAPLVLAVSAAPTAELIAGTQLTLAVSVAPTELLILDDTLTRDAQGQWSVPLSLRDPVLGGLSTFLQMLQTTPGPAISNGLQLHFTL